MSEIRVIYFDIGDTLAIADLTPTGRLASLAPLPGVLGGLDRLRGAGFRLGIISNNGVETIDTMRQVLMAAGIYPFLDARLLIYSSVVGVKKDSPEIFRLACQRAGFANKPRHCMFVGESPAERQFALQAGLQVAASLAAVVGTLAA